MWGCAGEELADASGRSVGLRRGAAAARGVQRAAEKGGAAVRRAGALCGIALGCSMRLRQGRSVVPRRSVAYGFARAQHAAALGRIVELGTCAGVRRLLKGRCVWPSKGHSVGLRRGAACSCAGAQYAAPLGRCVGLCRGAVRGCAGARHVALRETLLGRSVGGRTGAAWYCAESQQAAAHRRSIPAAQGGSVRLRRGAPLSTMELR